MTINLAGSKTAIVVIDVLPDITQNIRVRDAFDSKLQRGIRPRVKSAFTSIFTFCCLPTHKH
jgi:hypothetical protein